MRITLRSRSLLACSFIVCIAAGSAQAQFTAGRLAILELPFIWNGTSYTVPINGGQLVIREFATDGTPGISVPIPDSGPTMLVSPFLSGGASLTRSPSGDKLVFTGFTAASDGSFNLSVSPASQVPRGIGTVDGAGNYERPFTTDVFFDGGRMKAACTDGVNYWAGGDNSGVCYLGPGTPAVINADVTGTEDLHFGPNGLHRGVGSGGLQHVGTGSPLTAAPQESLFAMPLLLGFQLNAAGDVCYANDGFQIKKWVLQSGTWTNVYSFSAGTPLSRILVDWNAPQPIIYGLKNAPSSLTKWVDAGAPSSGTVLASVNGAAWYGIAFVPVECSAGGPCDDGNASTINDAWTSECLCAGELSTGIGNAAGPGTMVPYPNPTADVINISGDLPSSARYTVHDQLGSLVHTGTLLDRRIQCAAWPPGLYHMAVQDASGNTVAVLRVVKEE